MGLHRPTPGGRRPACTATVLVDVAFRVYIHQNCGPFLLTKLVDVAFADHIHQFCDNGDGGVQYT